MIGPIGSGNSLFSLLGATQGNRALPAEPEESFRPADLRRVRRAAVTLRRALERLRDGFGPVRRPGQAALARSESPLGLGPVGTPATLTSTEEVNTTPTSFTPYGPAFAGASTSEATLSGVYDGSDGTDTLTFEVKKGGTVGSNNAVIKFDVLDGGGSKIHSFDMSPGTPADTEITLDNGIVVSFSAGEVIKDDTFTVDVYDAVGTAVDPDNPFDGTRNSNPRLEPGLPVGTGTFEVNGVTIGVSASDSLNDVLDRITASAAGVTATFDAATETVRLTQNNPGSGFDITVGNDSSGFLASAKLAAATTVPGTDGESEDEIIANVSGLESISSGTALLNGVAIAVDIQADSLNDVLQRINSSGAGVTASFDPAGQRVTLRSDDPTASLVVDDGDTGLFSTLYIGEGTYEPEPGRSGTSPGRVGRLFAEVAEAFNALYREDLGHAALTGLKGDLRTLVEGVFGTDGPAAARRSGIRFDFRSGSRRVIDFGSRSAAQFRALVRGRPGELRDLLLRPTESGQRSLVDELILRLESGENDLRTLPERSGTLLDVVT